MIKNVRLKNFWNPQIFTHALPRTERISFSKILELMNQLFLSFLIHISFPNRILLKTTKVVFLYKQFSLFCSLISFKVSFDVLAVMEFTTLGLCPIIRPAYPNVKPRRCPDRSGANTPIAVLPEPRPSGLRTGWRRG